jgi:prepilin-type N-terminal cleavage/methylation domain-containing protein
MYIIKNKKKFQNKSKGFTLVELLVSIAIFGIISVVMTGIVLNMASVSYTVDRRTDFLNNLEAAVTSIKNEMRNAQSMGSCKSSVPNQPPSFYIIRKPVTRSAGGNPVSEGEQLKIESDRLVWRTLDPLNLPTTSNNLCNLDTTIPIPDYLTNSNMLIQNLNFVTSTDTAGKNTTLYTSFEACDAASVKRKIFSCDTTKDNLKPYRYMFAITTRNF